jgi:hypothetical protein
MFWFVIAHHPVLADAPSADGAISAPTAGSTTVTEGWEWSMYESWQFLEAAGSSEGFALPSGVKIFWNSDLLLQNDQGEVPSSCFLLRRSVVLPPLHDYLLLPLPSPQTFCTPRPSSSPPPCPSPRRRQSQPPSPLPPPLPHSPPVSARNMPSLLGR